MTNEKIKMMDTVIKTFGFEDERTINFCRMCENTKNFTMIVQMFDALMTGHNYRSDYFESLR